MDMSKAVIHGILMTKQIQYCYNKFKFVPAKDECLDSIASCFGIKRKVHKFLFIKWKESDQKLRKRINGCILKK